MRSASTELDLNPDESAMRGTNCEPRWLGENCSLRRDSACDQLAHSDARVFLIDNGCDDDLSIRRFAGGICGRFRGDAHRGDTGLHVGRAAPEDFLAANLCVEW